MYLWQKIVYIVLKSLNTCKLWLGEEGNIAVLRCRLEVLNACSFLLSQVITSVLSFIIRLNIFLIVPRTPLRYLLTPALEKTVEGHIQELKWKEMEKVAAYPGISDAEKVLHIPGGGITKLLFTER